MEKQPLAVEVGEVDEQIGESRGGIVGKKAWGFRKIAWIGGAFFVGAVVGALVIAWSSAAKSPIPRSVTQLQALQFTDPGAPDRRQEDFKNIICPFLSTLVNEGALPAKNSYTAQELQDVTREAGLPDEFSVPHIAGNFQNNPTGVQDIFNMEGAANEHVTSTGVHDCATLYFDCFRTSPGNNGLGIFEDEVIGNQIWQCSNQTIQCELPNEPRFNTFFSEIDVNGDGVLTVKELFETTPDNFNTGGSFQTFQASLIDANPIGEGSIAGSHLLIILAFGQFASLDVESPSDIEGSITKEVLRTVLVDRMFPEGFVFPAPPPPTPSTTGDRMTGYATTGAPGTTGAPRASLLKEGAILFLKSELSGLYLHVSSRQMSSGDPVFHTDSTTEGSEWVVKYVAGSDSTIMLKSVRSEYYLHVCAEKTEDGDPVFHTNSDSEGSQWQVEYQGSLIALKSVRSGFYLTASERTKRTCCDPVYHTSSSTDAIKWSLEAPKP